MSLREECDAAEVVWGALLDRHDMLRLLAVLASDRKIRDEDYEPLSARLTETLNQPPEEKQSAAAREAEIMRFVAETGGG